MANDAEARKTGSPMARSSSLRGGFGTADGDAFEDGPISPFGKLQHFLHNYPTMIPVIVLVIGVAVFAGLVGPRFFDPFNISLILQQVTIIAIIGMAQTLVILTAGVDLSVGSIMILSSIVMGRIAVINGVPIYYAFPIGLAVGLACGAVNGLLVTRAKLPPFIVTLGTWSIFGALLIAYSHSETIGDDDLQAKAPFLEYTSNVLNLPAGAVLTYGTIIAILLAIVLWYVLSQTAFGRHIYAVGDSRDAARLAGINTGRTLLAVYVIAGGICWLGGWVMIGRIGAVSAIAGTTSNLDSVTATVIGGTSLFGGRGSIVGTLIGALIVGVFRNGLALYGLDVIWQEFAVGVLILLAVTLDQWIRKVSE